MGRTARGPKACRFLQPLGSVERVGKMFPRMPVCDLRTQARVVPTCMFDSRKACGYTRVAVHCVYGHVRAARQL